MWQVIAIPALFPFCQIELRYLFSWCPSDINRKESFRPDDCWESIFSHLTARSLTLDTHVDVHLYC